MLINRRRFLVGLGGVAALVAAPSIVRSANIMPVRALPPELLLDVFHDEKLITTLTLKNLSSVHQAGGFITSFFGLPFKKGDIPPGFKPEFGDGMGSTAFNVATYSDGSLKFACFHLKVPVAIPASGELPIPVIKARGNLLSVPALSLTDAWRDVNHRGVRAYAPREHYRDAVGKLRPFTVDP